MTRVRTAAPNGLRALLCFKFDQNGPFNDIAKFKRAIIEDERVFQSADATGAFDFIVEARHPHLASHQEMMDMLSARFDHVIDHHDVSLICRRYTREADGMAGHFWVPSASGLQRLDHERIEKAAVEGDYVRLFCDGSSWLLHIPLKKIFEQVGTDQFLRINRSVIVRNDCIDRLSRQNRRWIAHLKDGSRYFVAQSRIASVRAQLRDDSDGEKHPSSGNGADSARTPHFPETALT